MVEQLAKTICREQVSSRSIESDGNETHRLFKVADNSSIRTFGTVSELFPNIIFLISCSHSHSFRSILIESDDFCDCLRVSSLFLSRNSCVLEKLLPFFR